MYVSIYAEEAPNLVRQLADTSEMKRLSEIGMHCGCEYACNPVYLQARGPYSRYVHSIGVANIVWNFTKDIRQTIAGLFHDIASPAFAHTIDFLNNDHTAQESTESRTRSFIERSSSIMKLLKEHNINIEEIDDYHKYPIADNDTPMLSADRLEYTLGNGYLVQKKELSMIKEIYEDLTVAENEQGEQELCFRSLKAAEAFSRISMINSRQFASNENRFDMQYLADLLRGALECNVISLDDLYTTESHVIEKIKGNSDFALSWETYTQIRAAGTSDTKLHDRYCVNIPAKKRYINPLVWNGGMPKRTADLIPEVCREMKSFLAVDFDKWIYAVMSTSE